MNAARAHKLATQVIGRISQRGEMTPVPALRGAVGIGMDGSYWIHDGKRITDGLSKDAAMAGLVESLTK